MTRDLFNILLGFTYFTRIGLQGELQKGFSKDADGCQVRQKVQTPNFVYIVLNFHELPVNLAKKVLRRSKKLKIYGADLNRIFIFLIIN